MNIKPLTQAFLLIVAACCLTNVPIFGDDDPDRASIKSSIDRNGTGSIIVEAHGTLPELPVMYTAIANADVQVGTQFVEQIIELTIKVIQGEAKTLSFGIGGDGDVIEVQGAEIRSWSVRQQGGKRFLDLHVKEQTTDLAVKIKARSAEFDLPTTADLLHLAPGDSVGFYSMINIQYSAAVAGVVIEASGFAALNKGGLHKGGLHKGETLSRFQTTTGGQIKLSLSRDGAMPGPVELVNTELVGELGPGGKSILFQLRGSALVSEANAKIDILSGNAAIADLPDSDDYRLGLATDRDRPVFQLVFPEPGEYPLELDFVAKLISSEVGGQSIDFTVGASAVVPLTIAGLGGELQFHRAQGTILPLRDGDKWLGFLPASGRTKMQWKSARKANEGKLFFSTTGYVEANLGAGLLRQDHKIQYKVLQGELKSISIELTGPGEILDVQGDRVVGWKIDGSGTDRQLDVTLSQPISAESEIDVRSQTALGPFPVRVEGLRLEPVGAIRHSGFLRLTNRGSVRLEPTGLSGLTQLAPDQFPGGPTDARQVFVYRFPVASHAFTIAADRIQPEVNISELVIYELAETDRKIEADIELDIREAPIREWDFLIPADYSVVSVTGASVADSIAATEAEDGRRNLKVVFNQDVIGRQLVSLRLEKSELAAGGNWILPRVEYPGAKTVRGDLGVIGAAGYRISVGETELLVEKPVSHFPKPRANLQQAFRIREPGWSATMRIELLDRSVQSDVFHLYSLSEETVYGSALINFFVTGAPVSEWKLVVPESLGNVMVDGQDVRTWRREGDTLIVVLHQPVMGAYTLLVTFEEKPSKSEGLFRAGQISPIGVQGERGYVQVVSPMQVEIKPISLSDDMLELDPLELPAEFRLLSTAPPLGTWQYTERPFELQLNVKWFEPGTMVSQVVEFSEANSRVSQDGELVTDVVYFVKSRGQRSLKLKLPDAPVRLWEISVNGQPVTARQSDDATLIPLPSGTDPNVPVEVSLRLGKPAVNESRPELMLPIVFAPVLKTHWKVVGDDRQVLVPGRGTIKPPVPVLRPSGFAWVAKQGIVPLFLIGLLTFLGMVMPNSSNVSRTVGLLSFLIAVGIALIAASTAFSQIASPSPLQLSLPVLSSGETVQLRVTTTPLWRANLSWGGSIALIAGIAVVAWSLVKDNAIAKTLLRWAGILLIALGVLMQRDAAAWFYGLLALAIVVMLMVPRTGQWLREFDKGKQQGDGADDSIPSDAFGPVTSVILMMAGLFGSAGNCAADLPEGFGAANSIKQTWKISAQDDRLTASGTIKLSGHPGDRFVLLRSPAVLTRFDGEGLRLTKDDVPGAGLTYILGIPVTENETAAEEEEPITDEFVNFEATFEYQVEAIKLTSAIAVLTGQATVQEVEISYDQAGWDVFSPTAVRVQAQSDAEVTRANILLGPGPSSIVLKPKVRDVTTEQSQFFVEASNLYLPGPGVVDGRHQLRIRSSQGQVQELNVLVPSGLTVSAVSGPVGSWQFDADSGRLSLEIEPAQSQPFSVMIETQRGLDPLPANVKLAPLKVSDASGEVGLVAVAFGAEAQPEKITPTRMSAVNLGDFDSKLMVNKQAVLHRVYRYGADGGELSVRVAPVAPEIRVVSKQVLSLGDERVVLGVNFTAEISRAGLFQLSFPLPRGLEVESLTGTSLHHWAELTEDGQRQIILHLGGKTVGTQNFSLALTGASPLVDSQQDQGEWNIPRFSLNEAARQSGELVVRPTTGIRLRSVSRQNVSETDPRSMGGESQGSLAFRLLQRDWNLVLGIEKLDAWITGQVLHEVTLREGQTRTALIASFDVQNASIRSLQVQLPIKDEDEIKTLRASGNTVSDFVRTDPKSNLWEVRFKRRVIGKTTFRIEYERRGDREDGNETLSPAGFPQSRQLSYYFAVRAGGRLELEHGVLHDGWQRVDWNMIPSMLRVSESRNAPVFALRAVTPDRPLVIIAKRHSLADALKLRVTQGSLTTVLSPTGDQLTAVDVSIEVVQRSSLSVGLPAGGELFSVFVNGESVNSIRQGGATSAWQFYILPGIDDRTAKVRFVYAVKGDRLDRMKLTSPELNVPLEKIQWNVIAPKGFELTDSDGNLELVRQANQKSYDRKSYLSKVSGKRQIQAQQAAELLDQANRFLQEGDQAKARRALGSVANQYALDAASNEDARVQLENLQTQQAIVGLNTRRQRLYLDSDRYDTDLSKNSGLREAAADNPILQQDQLNYRPQQLGELLRGNTKEDNANLQQMAYRLVQHQRTAELAPQAILINLPEEGLVYTFTRSVQVAENAPLELDLEFDSQYGVALWRSLLVLVLLIGFAFCMAFAATKLAGKLK